MNLTLQYIRPPVEHLLICGHCDDGINNKEEYKYVKFVLGKSELDFHEDCFAKVLEAFKKFSQIFIDERQGDPKSRVN